MNKKCNTSFLARPDALVTQRPVKKVVKKKEEKSDGVQVKKARVSKAVKQQKEKQSSS